VSKPLCVSRGSALVRISARLSFVLTRSVLIVPSSTFLQMKWCLTLMCLDLEWNSGLWVSLSAKLQLM
jgi:hypothetical protein